VSRGLQVLPLGDLAGRPPIPEPRPMVVVDGEGRIVTCEWFALCEDPADHLEPHPAFPEGVPACERCVGIGR
jgi:hypothetical protein